MSTFWLEITHLPMINSLGEDEHPVIRKSRSECKDDIERRLWDMHESNHDDCWSCGKYVARKISPKKNKNTKLHYMYRDSGNNKTFDEVIIKGSISEEQLIQLKELLLKLPDAIEPFDDNMFCFEPRIFGWPELNPSEEEWDFELDHEIHELWFDDIEETEQKPTVNISIDDMLNIVNNVLEQEEKWEENSR